MTRTAIVLSAILVPLAPLAVMAARSGLEGDTARVFKGGHGEEIALVMLKPPADGNALVRFAGTASVLDGLVLPCKRSVNGNRELYSTDWRGRRCFLNPDYHTLTRHVALGHCLCAWAKDNLPSAPRTAIRSNRRWKDCGKNSEYSVRPSTSSAWTSRTCYATFRITFRHRTSI